MTNAWPRGAADVLRRVIHALGDYGQVSVRAARGHLTIFVDAGVPLAGSPRLERGIRSDLPHS